MHFGSEDLTKMKFEEKIPSKIFYDPLPLYCKHQIHE